MSPPRLSIAVPETKGSRSSLATPSGDATPKARLSVAVSGVGEPSAGTNVFDKWEQGAFASITANPNYFFAGTTYTTYEDLSWSQSNGANIDETLYGAVNLAAHNSKTDERLMNLLLEYLLGYSSEIDPADLSHQRRSAAITKKLCFKYAAGLDKSLPERSKQVLRTLLRQASAEHVKAEREGEVALTAFRAFRAFHRR